MLNNFISFVYEIFPSIDSTTYERTRKSIQDSVLQFDGVVNDLWFSSSTLENFSQGDILSDFIYTDIDDEGNDITIKTNVMIISNSCDIENDDRLILAPIFNLEKFTGFSENTISNIKKNTSYGKMCLTGSALDSYFVDFSKIVSIRKSLINDLIERNYIDRKYSLSRFGFYFLIAKLTIHFLRPEDITHNNSRDYMASEKKVMNY